MTTTQSLRAPKGCGNHFVMAVRELLLVSYRPVAEILKPNLRFGKWQPRLAVKIRQIPQVVKDGFRAGEILVARVVV